jgi:hypothetical protein
VNLPLCSHQHQEQALSCAGCGSRCGKEAPVSWAYSILHQGSHHQPPPMHLSCKQGWPSPMCSSTASGCVCQSLAAPTHPPCFGMHTLCVGDPPQTLLDDIDLFIIDFPPTIVHRKRRRPVTFQMKRMRWYQGSVRPCAPRSAGRQHQPGDQPGGFLALATQVIVTHHTSVY